MSTLELLRSDVPFEMKYAHDDESELLTPTESAINSVIFRLCGVFRMPIKKKYSVTSYYVNGFLNKRSISMAYSAILDDFLMEYNHDIKYRLEDIATATIMSGFNEIYNDVALESRRHDGSVLMTELLDIQMEPKLLEAIAFLNDNPQPQHVSTIFSTLKDIIFSKKHRKNGVAIAYLSETVSPRQLNQCLGVRGFASDLDNRIYQTPIATSYTLGLRDIKDASKESRGAAIALKNSTDAITKSETFARETQMITEIVDELTREDCGTTDGLIFHVRPPGMTDANEKFAGDLRGIVGQYYKLRPEDDWKLIRSGDSRLFGQTIILRTALSCKAKHKNQICIACYGKFGYHIPKGFNVGHWSCSKMNEPASQSLLSTKHYLVSADGGVTSMTGEDLHYFRTDKHNKIFLNFDMRKYKEIKILVPDEALSGLSNIQDEDTLLSAEIWNVSHVKEFTLELVSNTGEYTKHTVRLSKYAKTGVFSNFFVSHAINKYEHSGRNYVINLKGFNTKKPLVLVPDVVFDYSEYNKELRKVLQDSKTREGEKIYTAGQLTKALYSLINVKLYAHVSALAVIAYAMTAEDAKNEDYRLVRGVEAPVTTASTLLNKRTLALSLAYGKVDTLFKIDVTDQYNAETHPLAVLFDPAGMMNN